METNNKRAARSSLSVVVVDIISYLFQGAIQKSDHTNIQTTSSERSKLKLPVISDEPLEYPKPDLAQMKCFKPIATGTIGEKALGFF